ncbi:hypothetical protein Hypma_013876 [Hypsizygus marmoreus]|uniref:Uncharacterized protein n=1 Tax=Hypsizygus marmoreus TaxID=39966 RepID=A0A369K8L0_HYPMA|nr:hypothetical protein Hypma_013876 [Hypsizygus marmoreus]
MIRKGDRAPTPPILHDPIVDNDDSEDESSSANDELEWYYGENAGGYVLNFGKHKGQVLHNTSISYLYWCYKNFNPNHSLIGAFELYHEGLEEYAKTHYAEFVVPFGRKHQGKRIAKCRDKDWLLWTTTRKALTDKYPIFFVAVQYWLENPRHQGVKRDIGELLRCSEYEDDLELAEETEDSDEDALNESDIEFINDGEPDYETDASDIQEESEDEESPQYVGAALSRANESDSEEELESSSRSTTPPRLVRMAPKKRKIKRKKRETKSQILRDFVVNDDDGNGSDAYVDPDGISTPDPSITMRVTRSSTKKKAEATKSQRDTYSPVASRSKRGKRLTETEEGSSEDEGSTPKTPSLRARRAVVTSDADDEGEESDSIPTLNFAGHAKATSLRQATAVSLPHDCHSDVFSCENQSPGPSMLRGRNSNRVLSSDSEDSDDEPLTLAPTMADELRRVRMNTSPGETESSETEEWQPRTPTKPSARKRVLSSDSESPAQQEIAITRTSPRTPSKYGKKRARMSHTSSPQRPSSGHGQPHPPSSSRHRVH